MEKKKTINFGEIISVLKKNFILLCSVFAAIIIFGFVFTFAVLKDNYKSTSGVIVEVPLSATSTSETTDSTDVTSSLRYVTTVAELICTNEVLTPVATNFGMEYEELDAKVSVSSSTTSLLIMISVVDHDPALAQELANGIADQIVKLGANSSDSTYTNKLLCNINKHVEARYGTYASPNKPLYILMFVAIGLVSAAAVVFIKEFASNKFKNKEEIEELGYQIIGVHMYKKNAPEEDDELVEPTISKLEPYNRVLSNIKYASLDNPYKVMMVTSTGSKELKTNMVGNLAFTAARNHKRVLAIDLDVRKPRLHKVFGVERENGMTDFLDGTIANDFKFIKKTVHDVDVITAGKQIDNPYVVFESQKLKDFMDAMKDKYDYIFIDTPPVSICGDGLAISKLCDGVIYNIGMNYVKKNDAKEGLDALKNVDANIIGINITRYRASKAETYYSYYNYYGETEGKKRK